MEKTFILKIKDVLVKTRRSCFWFAKEDLRHRDPARQLSGAQTDQNHRVTAGKG
jgi:hypothetical protein